MEYYSSLDASQLDSETPTLFEIISSNQLESLLSPSLRYILVHYASRYPYYLLKVVNNFDEINLFFRSFIEWYFMKYWHGSFTENFYGLKRVNKTPIKTSKLIQLSPLMLEDRRKLSNIQIWVSILEVTGTSYISEKLNYWYELLHPKFITNQLNITDDMDQYEKIRMKIRIWFVKIFPYIQSVVKLGNFIALLSYLNGSKSPSLLTFLFGINYSRLNQHDYQEHDNLKAPHEKPTRVNPPTSQELILKYLMKYFSRPILRSLKLILGTFFPVAIFSLKFLEWWNGSEFSQQLKKSDHLDKVLPPPNTVVPITSLSDEKTVKKVYKSGDKCPLCHEEINNPAVIETGYVFCYTCIYNYLSNSHKIIGERAKARRNALSDSEDDDSEEEAEGDNSEKEGKIKDENKGIDITKGGRCPITGVKLLGCKWNELKNEWEINNIRKVIF